MVAKERSKLAAALEAVPDPRRQCKNLRHRLVDVLLIGFCGVLCGSDDFVEIEEFGRSKEEFFRRFLELPNGIPSHDTFRRVFQAVCPQALQRCLIHWLQGLRQTAQAAASATRSSPSMARRCGEPSTASVAGRAAPGERLGDGQRHYLGTGGRGRQVQRDHRDSPTD